MIVQWNWDKDASIVDDFKQIEECETLEQAELGIIVSIDIQEDAGERPLKYRVIDNGVVVLEVDAATLTPEQRLQYCHDVRDDGKAIANEVLGLELEMMFNHDDRKEKTVMTCVDKKDVKHEVVGPIAEGETPEMAVARLESTFGFKAAKYAFSTHAEPLTAKNQQFPVIIGTVWIEKQ